MNAKAVDWPRLLDDLAWLYGEPDPANPALLRIALGTPTLAERLLVSRGTLRRWMEEGAEPRHSDGEMLIERWLAVTGKNREYLPKAIIVMSASQMKRD